MEYAVPTQNPSERPNVSTHAHTLESARFQNVVSQIAQSAPFHHSLSPLNPFFILIFHLQFILYTHLCTCGYIYEIHGWYNYMDIICDPLKPSVYLKLVRSSCTLIYHVSHSRCHVACWFKEWMDFFLEKNMNLMSEHLDDWGQYRCRVDLRVDWRIIIENFCIFYWNSCI